jgi:CTD kinase subunit gamma
MTASSSRFSRNDVFKRIEEDRERHKRLRERRWVQPVSNYAPLQVPPLATFLPNCGQVVETGVQGELPIDVEFENEWETTSDWNEDDDEAATEENHLCFPSGDPGDDHLGGRTVRSEVMDLS